MSFELYKNKYEQKGYGVEYPDAHVIRFYERILKYKLNKTSGKLLDFGCGNGTHAKYFKDKGFKVCGADIVPSLQEKWNKNVGDDSKYFNITNETKLEDIIDEKIDVIFANQSLYYLPKDILEQRLSSFYNICNENAIIFASMMSTKNYYYAHSLKSDGWFRSVKLDGRLKESCEIHFINTQKELEETFSLFKPLFVGDYDPINFYDFEGSAHHFIFIGQK